jgi:hypothetical protein
MRLAIYCAIPVIGTLSAETPKERESSLPVITAVCIFTEKNSSPLSHEEKQHASRQNLSVCCAPSVSRIANG